MKNIIYTILLSFTMGVLAQNNKINIGDKQNQKLAYFDAIKTYEKIVNKGYANAEIFEKIGDAYYYNANYKTAAKWYRKLFSLSKNQILNIIIALQ